MAKGDKVTCWSCQKEFIQGRNTFGYYCSIKCQQDYQWEQKKQQILAEGKVPNSRMDRRFLLERDGHVCQFPGCGCREWNGRPVPLVLDHIDGNPENWSLDNVRLTCPNCDAQTGTYKNRNRGRGRHSRKIYSLLPNGVYKVTRKRPDKTARSKEAKEDLDELVRRRVVRPNEQSRQSLEVYPVCPGCNLPFVPNSISVNGYCCAACLKDHEWKLKVEEIEKLGAVGNSWQGRRYLLEKHGHKCDICGRTEWHGKPISLVLDHKDGNSGNWAVTNIRLICSTCDAQTPTYKNRNKGRGRAYRRDRYHSGQSY